MDIKKKVSITMSPWMCVYYLFNLLYYIFVVLRVLHKGSIPTGQLISPKTTHSNIATWSEMRMLTVIISQWLGFNFLNLF